LTPEYYQEFRRELHEALEASAKHIEANAAAFEKTFGRKQTAFVEETGRSGGLAVITMGSLAEQCEMQAEAGEFDLIRLKCLRPFPREALARALKGRKRVLVIEKSFSAGNEGALAIEVKALLKDIGSDAIVTGAVTGLGGRDVSVRVVHELAGKAAKAEESSRVWV
jgi:pyruvate/2-oxoacid:ferredoxin oxidoreductase alpha subunit